MKALIIYIIFTLSINNYTITNNYNIIMDEYIEYAETANSILTNYKHKFDGYILAKSWIQTKLKYEIDIPVTLALAQAQLESGFGTKGLGREKNNPYNIRKGNGEYVRYKTMEEGILAYYELMATKYLSCKDIDELLENFTNCNNKRYAEYPQYEQIVQNQIGFYERKYLSL